MEAKTAGGALFARSATDRVVAGVAGGIGERLGIDANLARLAFVVLAFAGGFGIVLYLLAWLVAAEPHLTVEPMESRSGLRVVVAVALIVAGVLLLLREAGLWLGDAVLWSVGLAAFGSAIIWTRGDDAGRARFAKLTSRLPRTPADAFAGRSKGRIAAGALLVIAGMVTFLAANTSLRSLGNVFFAVAVTVAGLGLILGPWMYQLLGQLGTERRERIRSEERAEVAAHLHDSALQTLAMIQRASSPQEMVTLARVQERELRAWLYGRTTGPDELSRAIDVLASRVEGVHRVKVDTVVVGEAPLDDKTRALVDAIGEATTNAAKHSAAATVSVYVEVADDAITAYVRDEGKGFDPDAAPADRRGIAESIVGRMQRHGGTATITSDDGQGTEVRLSLPRKPA